MPRSTVLAVLTLILLVTACGATSSAPPASGAAPAASAPQYTVEGKDVTALYEAAKKEGKLVWYGGAYTNDQAKAYFDEFARDFPGIQVEIYRNATPVVLQRFMDEANAGKTAADILMQGDPFTLADIGKKGLLLEYAPGTAALYPHPAVFGKWVQPHGQTLVGPIYNASLVTADDEKRLQTDWKFLTDPKWKGKMAASLPEAGGTSYGPTYMFLGELRDQFGPDFIKALKPNVVKTFASTVPATEQVAAGEFAIHPWGYTVAAGDLLAKGANIRQAFPPPTPIIYLGMAIPKNAPHPNAAKLYEEWSFSKKGQELMVKICSAASARTDLKLDPYTQYPWYVKPTKFFEPADLDKYMAGLTTIKNEWHDLMGVK